MYPLHRQQQRGAYVQAAVVLVVHRVPAFAGAVGLASNRWVAAQAGGVRVGVVVARGSLLGRCGAAWMRRSRPVSHVRGSAQRTANDSERAGEGP
jgi:hypothetical protein